MSWGYYKWNNAALSNKTHACCVCRHIAKLCSYILCKNNSLKNGIKKKHHSNKFLNCLLVGCTKFHKRVPSGIWKVISPTWESIFLFEKNIFQWRESINWGILTQMSKVVILAVYSSWPIHTTKSRTDTRKWVTS